MSRTTETEAKGPTIPQPPRLPLVGNLLDIDRTAPAQSFMRLARRYGPIYRLQLPGRTLVVLSSRELVNEVCDQQRFDKLVNRSLQMVRMFGGDGLFTAWTFEPNWKKAHHILMPTFGPAAMQGYLPQMVDVADQLLGKWARLNRDDVIDVPDDMTRLTLDTIGLCGFDYRFNSFYREDPHPFVGAMVRALGESLLRANRLPVHEALLLRAHHRQKQDIEFMNGVVDRLIRERRADPDALAAKHDLLNHMLAGADPASGERLDDVNIRYQILTFLIAGHETTSGLLSFSLYFLMKHPEALARAFEEVDAVLDPQSAPTIEQVRRLTYVQQVLKESLRLWPTAPAFTLYPLDDTTLQGKYPVRKGENLVVLLPTLHRDPAVWGDDAEAFRPERFAPEREQLLPANAYKPFGNGQRACIGQQFAMQEATLVLGMVLRQFEPFDHAGYTLRVKETLTLKPEGLTMKVRPRMKRAVVRPIPSAGGVAKPETKTAATPVGNGTPLLVLFGSNLGTSQGVAQRIAEDGRAHGFDAAAAPLDEYVGRLPTAGAVVIVVASYNGTPPDNATRFDAWLRDEGTDQSLSGVRFAVFGCGDHNWAATYQAVPRRIDEGLAARGAARICPRGEGDVADDLEGQFRRWYGEFWKAAAAALGLAIGEVVTPARSPIRIESVNTAIDVPVPAAFGAFPLIVSANRELLRDGADRSTRHIELRLPDGVSYRAGDHLGVLPRNRPAIIRRVLDRFRQDGAGMVILRRDDAEPTHLPLGIPLRLTDVLASAVELQAPATRDQIGVLADRTACPPEKGRLIALSRDDEQYREQILSKRVSLLGLLEQFPACELFFPEFLDLLPPQRPRYYSISSSPLVQERVASITVGVVRGPARSGQGVYEGVASNYLAELAEGDTALAFVRDPGTPFRLPAEPRTPIIMIGAGTGLAPFRGFLQERAAQRSRGEDVGPALLFFGCRHPAQDFLYEDELRGYESQGLVHIIPAFSRLEGHPKCYVQNAISARAQEVWDLLGRGAVTFVCGDAAGMAAGVRRAFQDLYQATTGATAEPAQAWWNDLQTRHRYIEDVWASS